MSPVLLRKRERKPDVGPCDAQRRVVKTHPPVGSRTVKVVALVAEERVVLEHDEAMGESARDEALPAVLAGQRHGDVPPEGRRPLADVDGHVPHRSADHAHKLRLRVRGGLPVEAAHHALRRKALVVLDEVRVNAGRLVARGVVLLDERGTERRSVEFAKWLTQKNMSTRSLVFVIGGPYGFSDAVYQRANERISLSSMTFSHQMVRLFFVEQLYRACTIIKGEPYHHE